MFFFSNRDNDQFKLNEKTTMKNSFIDEETNNRSISKDSTFNSNQIENECKQDEFDDDDDEQIDVNIVILLYI